MVVRNRCTDFGETSFASLATDNARPSEKFLILFSRRVMRDTKAHQAYMTQLPLARFIKSTFSDATCGKLVSAGNGL
jgi:hypothetical protein